MVSYFGMRCHASASPPIDIIVEQIQNNIMLIPIDLWNFIHYMQMLFRGNVRNLRFPTTLPYYSTSSS